MQNQSILSNAAVRHRYSLRTSLLWLAAVCVLPTSLISASLLYSNYQLRRAQLEQNTLLLARKVVSDIENEMSAIESALKVLATAPEFASGDFRGIHQRARGALSSGTVYNYILTDRKGEQLLNTLRPYGEPLPTQGNPAQLERVFTLETTVLTDLFIGPVTHKPAIAMGVPVRVHDKVLYSLNIGLAPDRLNEILARQRLPEQWLIAVLDTSGTIVARSRDEDRFLGQKAVPELLQAVTSQREGQFQTQTKEGIPVFTSFARSNRWNWSVAVGAPVAKLEAEIWDLLWRVFAGTALALVAGLLLALWLARRVLATVRGLNDAAKALYTGGQAQLPDIQFREAEAVGEAIREASHAMEQVKYMAHHDTLTGLANRALFTEFASKQLALSERHQESMALIAIDLDGFKEVNDTQGHAMGDEVLIAVARRIENVLRSSDTAARLGGDEFMVLLAETDIDSATRTADRLVEQLAEPYPMTPCRVSASVGVAVYPAHGTQLQELMSQADKALYAAKAAGKRRAVLAGTQSR